MLRNLIQDVELGQNLSGERNNARWTSNLELGLYGVGSAQLQEKYQSINYINEL